MGSVCTGKQLHMHEAMHALAEMNEENVMVFVAFFAYPLTFACKLRTYSELLASLTMSLT